MKNSEHGEFAERKFRSFAFQVIFLNLCFLSGVVGVVGGFINPALLSLDSLWSLWFIGPVFLVLYGLNELFKLMKLVIGGWFLCHDCRRPKAKRARCTRMKEGIMVDVCKSCLVHFEAPTPLIPKVSPHFPLWASGKLGSPPEKPVVAKPPILHV
jgi:hypothetical protein